jgi:hypothetical protein
MKYFGILSATFAVPAIAVSSAQCAAQTSSTSSQPAPQVNAAPADLSGASYKSRPLPQTRVLTPFSADVPESAKTDPLEYRSKDQIAEADRPLIASAEPKIREEAALAGIELDKGSWSYQQLVCKALPSHIFLLYRADNGPGDVSRFSAAISRGSNHVRVIPIERRGYSLFTPTSMNALTISAFNRIRSDEPENKQADWLATALCYASLAGAQPGTSPTSTKSENADPALNFPPTLEVGKDGKSTVRFVDIASTRQPTQWALTFSPQGQLIKVVHFPTPTYAVRPIP